LRRCGLHCQAERRANGGGCARGGGVRGGLPARCGGHQYTAAADGLSGSCHRSPRNGARWRNRAQNNGDQFRDYSCAPAELRSPLGTDDRGTEAHSRIQRADWGSNARNRGLDPRRLIRRLNTGGTARPACLECAPGWEAICALHTQNLRAQAQSMRLDVESASMWPLRRR
jgi:hypothetical protein